jgi:hypothetical protein
MKSYKNLIALTFILIISTSCYNRHGWPVRGEGATVVETRHASGFDRIELACEGEVEYTQDSVFYLEVNAQSNIMRVLRTEVQGGELKIWFDRNVQNHKTIRIIVHGPQMRGLSLSGSGNIKVQNSLKTDNLECVISGSGDIRIPRLTATTINGRISGSGDLKVEGGTVSTEHHTISGSGSINTEWLVASHAGVKISGSGSSIINVTEDLTVNISGSGSVSYRGRPVIDTDISGSGRLIRLQ